MQSKLSTSFARNYPIIRNHHTHAKGSLFVDFSSMSNMVMLTATLPFMYVMPLKYHENLLHLCFKQDYHDIAPCEKSCLFLG
jgi:hypothetical protein